jgi:hypothetical protein
MNLIYHKAGKGKDKTYGRIIMTSGKGVAIIYSSQNTHPLKVIH